MSLAPNACSSQEIGNDSFQEAASKWKQRALAYGHLLVMIKTCFPTKTTGKRGTLYSRVQGGGSNGKRGLQAEDSIGSGRFVPGDNSSKEQSHNFVPGCGVRLRAGPGGRWVRCQMIQASSLGPSLGLSFFI